MAFGLSPKYIQDVPLDNLTPEQFLVLAIEAAKKLDWNIAYASETGFVAFTKFSMRSWSEEVKVKIDGNNATLKSECTGNQLVDWGKNEDNLQNLISTFNELETKVSFKGRTSLKSNTIDIKRKTRKCISDLQTHARLCYHADSNKPEHYIFHNDGFVGCKSYATRQRKPNKVGSKFPACNIRW